MADYNNENYRFRLSLRDKATGTDIGVGNLQSVELILSSEFNGAEWLRFKYPTADGWEPMTLEPGNAALVVEVTPDNSATAPKGTIIAQATYRITDGRYASGYKQTTKRGRILNIKEARP